MSFQDNPRERILCLNGKKPVDLAEAMDCWGAPLRLEARRRYRATVLHGSLCKMSWPPSIRTLPNTFAMPHDGSKALLWTDGSSAVSITEV